MTYSEKVGNADRIVEMERPKASERQGTRTDLTSGPAGPEVAEPYRRSADVAADVREEAG